MTTSQIIRESAPYHARMIAAIAELDHIPSAVSKQTAHLGDLEAQLQRSEAKLKNLSKVTKREREEHEALHNSTVRRFAHKLTGREEIFKAKENKEEREFIEALEQELSERDNHDTLHRMISEAKQVEMELSANAVQYYSLKKELADLYTRIFDGPTEEFPEDDKLEHKLKSSQALHDQIQLTLSSESQAVEILARADKTLDACEAKIQEALKYSKWDVWGGGAMSDMMERDSLSMAQSLATQTELLYRQAQNMSPFVQDLGRLAIAQGSLMSDVFFDNIFTDMAFHEKIKNTAAGLSRAHSHLKAERDAANHRVNTAGNELTEAAQALQENRIALDSFRREAFRTVSEGDDTDLPPSYHATIRPACPPPCPPPIET